jgi:hypothetical protein
MGAGSHDGGMSGGSRGARGGRAGDCWDREMKSFLMTLPSANTYGGQYKVSLRFKICGCAVHLFKQFRNEPEPNKGDQECNN